MKNIKPGPQALASVRTEDLITELNYRFSGGEKEWNYANKPDKPGNYIALVSFYEPDHDYPNDRVVEVSIVPFYKGEWWANDPYYENMPESKKNFVVAWQEIPGIPE